MSDDKPKPSRVDTERELYRPEVFENHMHDIYGTPIAQQPISSVWFVLATAAVAIVYYFFLMSQYVPNVAARVTGISESGVVTIEAQMGLEEFRKSMTSTSCSLLYGRNLEREFSVKILANEDCLDDKACSQIVVSAESPAAINVLEQYPNIAIKLSPKYLYENIF